MKYVAEFDSHIWVMRGWPHGCGWQ